MPTNSDDEARAGLLCYFVVGEPVSMARTGNWLNTGHPVEPGRVWITPTVRGVTGRTGSSSRAWRPILHPTSSRRST
jgi:hypothetical protein